MKKNLLTLTIFAMLGACAATYQQPKTIAPPSDFAIPGSTSEILKKAKIALVRDGYQITSVDDAAGIISTAPRDLRVTPADADCGTTMGIDYLKDNRTSTRVSIGVIVGNGQTSIKATIQGEYKPGAVDQNITLTCVSRGTIEPSLAAKITAP